jgi:hypothetical protein
MTRDWQVKGVTSNKKEIAGIVRLTGKKKNNNNNNNNNRRMSVRGKF